MKKEKIEDMILYNGSLEELNTTSLDFTNGKKYRLAGLEFVSQRYDLTHEEVTKGVKILLRSMGYDGLVNKRMIVDNGGTYIEGTPIKEKRKPLHEQIRLGDDLSG